MDDTRLAACIPLDTWFYACIPQERDTWFTARVTLGWLHVFFLTLVLLHVLVLISRDSWFIALVTLDLLHVFNL